MTQPIDYMTRPIYNGVKINIKKPEVNAGGNTNTYTDDNGIYNAVSIDIDNPSVNTQPKPIYDYPQATEIVTYDMLHPNRCPMPQGFNVAYTTTNVILPKIENELEINGAEEFDEAEEIEEIENEEAVELEEPNVEAFVVIEETDEAKEEDEIPTQAEQIQPEIIVEEVVIPEPNYTTTEAEKGIVAEEVLVGETPAVMTEDIVEEVPPQAEVKPEEEVKVAEQPAKTYEAPKTTVVDLKEMAEASKVEPKRPEIIPEEEILPEIDIPTVVSNLSNKDYDVQAEQMEKIARVSMEDPQNAVPYIVREVFGELIEITQKDTKNLAAPTEEQVEARKKMIANFIALGNAKQTNTKPELPYQLTERDYVLANELSPMELAERNKEYALYTMSILSKVYVDEVERHTGNVIPLTDLPGSAAIVDALRYNPNAGIKIAALDALKHIERPEYKEELTTLYTLAQADANPQVAQAATYALAR